MIRVYIAGPMTGLPDANYPAFNAVAAHLRGLGFHVENPAENMPPDPPTWANWMRIALRQMLTCEEVVLLPGWETSRGATLERSIAGALGLRVRILGAAE